LLALVSTFGSILSKMRDANLDCLTPLVAFAVPHAASQATSIGLSVAKTSYPLGTLLMKGILCNWMVCMGEPS
jgi:hypothetical protein